MRLVDTHIHLMLPDYASELTRVLERAKESGVVACIAPGLDTASSQLSIDLHDKHPMILPAVGLHPLSPAEDLSGFKSFAALPEVVAIGEVGTDKKAGEWSAQEERLRYFLELAIELEKPVLLHVRDTWGDTLKILADYPKLRHRIVIHCFTGGKAEAEAIQKLDILLSCTAIIAREGLVETREVIRNWPLERMMLETDGPWLSWPGEAWPNEPKTVAKIAEFIAGLKCVSTEEVAEKTTQTTEAFFSKKFS